MSSEWELFREAEVGSEGYIPFPEEVSERVAVDNAVHGPSVYWNYESNADIIILSSDSLRNSGYIPVTRTNIYDIDSVGESGGRIRMPDGMPPAIASSITPGSIVYFAVHEEMVSDGVSSVYLLSKTQALRLLPGDSNPETTDELSEAVLEVPGLFG